MWKTLIHCGWLFSALLSACGAPDPDVEESMSTAGDSTGGKASVRDSGAGGNGGTPKAGAGGSAAGGVREGGSGGTFSGGGGAGAAGAAPGAGGTAPVTPITGTPGVWENVSPAGHPELFDINDPNCSSCNYGSLGVEADPAHPGTFYSPFCYHGVYKSTDWGLTWAKVSKDGGPMDNGGGRLAIAPDGSYMIAWLLYPHNGYQNAAWISTDGAVNFTQYDLPIPDPMYFEISWKDKTRIAGANHQHEINDFFESTDSGHTWVDQGPIFQEPTMGSPALHWIDDDTLLAVDDGDAGDGGGTYRGVRSSSTWPWKWTWTKVSNQQHFHAYHDIFNDQERNVLYNGGAFGIERSTDKGLTWQKVSNNYSSCIVGTATKLYSTANYATGGDFGPWLMVADRSTGTDWVLWKSQPYDGRPAGMINGWASASVGFDGQHYVILGGNWLAGLWRYVEP
jgi:hypothetical protein